MAESFGTELFSLKEFFVVDRRPADWGKREFFYETLEAAQAAAEFTLIEGEEIIVFKAVSRHVKESK